MSFRSSRIECVPTLINKHQRLEKLFLKGLEVDQNTEIIDAIVGRTFPSFLRVLRLPNARLTSDQLLTVALTNPHLEDFEYSFFDRTQNPETRGVWLRVAGEKLPKLKYLTAPLRTDIDLPIAATHLTALKGLRLEAEFTLPGTDAEPPADYVWDDYYDYYYDSGAPTRIGELDLSEELSGDDFDESLRRLSAQLPPGVGANVISYVSHVLEYALDRKAEDAILQLSQRGFRFNDEFWCRFLPHPLMLAFSKRPFSESKVQQMLAVGADPTQVTSAVLKPISLWLWSAGFYLTESPAINVTNFICTHTDCYDAYPASPQMDATSLHLLLLVP